MGRGQLRAPAGRDPSAASSRIGAPVAFADVWALPPRDPGSEPPVAAARAGPFAGTEARGPALREAGAHATWLGLGWAFRTGVWRHPVASGGVAECTEVGPVWLLGPAE